MSGSRPIIPLGHEDRQRPTILLSNEHTPEAENFIELEQIVSMVQSTLVASGRINTEGVIQPIEVVRGSWDDTGDRPQWGLLPSVWRTDLFVPERTERQTYETYENGRKIQNLISFGRLSDFLYTRLVREFPLQLSESDIESLRVQEDEFRSLLDRTGKFSVLKSEEQLSDAYHLSVLENVSPDIADTRIYVPGGTGGMFIVQLLIEEGVKFSAAKIWTPQLSPADQKFRSDTPILVAKTLDEVGSILKGLRLLRQNGQLLESESPLAGREVQDLPGVYIGQNPSGVSFNGNIANLFGSALEDTCSALNMQAGDLIGPDLIYKIATQVRIAAMSNAHSRGISARDHAFLDQQPINAILAKALA